MHRKDSKPKQPAKSHYANLYARRQRRRAEKIIQADGVYSAAFRNEVQQALDNFPHKLPLLFRDADRIDERLVEKGRQFRRKGSRPVSRSPKRIPVRIAEEVESLFIQHRHDVLDDSMAERAQLISDILFDIGNESQINATHHQLVKAYILAIEGVMPSLESRAYKTVETALGHVRDLVNGCPEARFQHIANYWSVDHEVSGLARKLEAGEIAESEYLAAVNDAAVTSDCKDRILTASRLAIKTEELESETPDEASELASLRRKLAELETLPENEAIRFQLETDIYRLERQESDEWPDTVAA